jgi:3-methylcrotonyl-CoA carboxylase alpha subunit
LTSENRRFAKLLVTNRGEIACRVMATASKLGIGTVSVYSDADARARHVEMADEAVWIGAAAPAESYLRGDRIIEAALATGAGAIHPGYGFLSENPDFVEAVEAAGLIFVGPSADAIRAMGLKDAYFDQSCCRRRR